MDGCHDSRWADCMLAWLAKLVVLRVSGEHGGQGERREGEEAQDDGRGDGVREDVDHRRPHADRDRESRRRRRDQQIRHRLIAGEIKEARVGVAAAHPAEVLQRLRRRVHERDHGHPEKIPSKSSMQSDHPAHGQQCNTMHALRNGSMTDRAG